MLAVQGAAVIPVLIAAGALALSVLCAVLARYYYERGVCEGWGAAHWPRDPAVQDAVRLLRKRGFTEEEVGNMTQIHRRSYGP